MHKGYGTKLTRKEKKEFTRRYPYLAQNPFINMYVSDAEGGGIYIRQEVQLWFYILIFIPLHLIQVIICLWDGGLKTFEIANRYLTCDYCPWGSPNWKIANKILKFYEENEE